MYLHPTKLYRPPAPADTETPSRLLEALRMGTGCDVVLISAPAGFGKTTLASRWLEDCGRAGGWVSLDERDNELPSFVAYLVAAVRSSARDACARAAAAIDRGSVPEPELLADELFKLAEPVTLVLDSYERIDAPGVHEYMAALLRYPLPKLHLVVVTRRNPPLPLASLRAQGRLLEFHADDLALTSEEAEAFLARVVGKSIDVATSNLLQGLSEGWPLAIRLMGLYLRTHAWPRDMAAAFTRPQHSIAEYLSDEVFAWLGAPMRDRLLRVGILDQFDAGLCDEMFVGACGQGPDGQGFIERLLADGLFLVPLDATGDAFRLHHLFREFLRAQPMPDEERWELHDRAACALSNRGLVGDAVAHALYGADPSYALEIVWEHHHALLEQERYGDVFRWCRQLPERERETRPEALLLLAWAGSSSDDLPSLLDKIRGALQCHPPGERLDAMEGELALLEALNELYTGSGAEAADLAARALALLPAHARAIRADAWFAMALASLRTRGLEEAQRSIEAGLQEMRVEGGRPYAILLTAACYVDWLQCDLNGLALHAGNILDGELVRRGSMPWESAMELRARAAYQRDELQEAERLLDTPGHVDFFIVGIARVMTLDALGRVEEAEALLEALFARARAGRMAMAEADLRAVEAALALRRGQAASVAGWARGKPEDGPQQLIRLVEPRLIRAAVLAHLSEETDRARAQIGELRLLGEQGHDSRLLAQTLALEAVLAYRAADPRAARAALDASLAITRSADCVRLYLDLGPLVVDAMRRLAATQGRPDPFVERILRAAGRPRTGSDDAAALQATEALASPLTDRELDVLALLGLRLSNKEIARRLDVTLPTVKRHAANLYRKLGVKSRRAAVQRALALGLLVRQ